MDLVYKKLSLQDAFYTHLWNISLCKWTCWPSAPQNVVNLKCMYGNEFFLTAFIKSDISITWFTKKCLTGALIVPHSPWRPNILGAEVKNERLLSDVKAQARHLREPLTPRARMWFTGNRGIKADPVLCVLSWNSSSPCYLSQIVLPPGQKSLCFSDLFSSIIHGHILLGLYSSWARYKFPISSHRLLEAWQLSVRAKEIQITIV